MASHTETDTPTTYLRGTKMEWLFLTCLSIMIYSYGTYKPFMTLVDAIFFFLLKLFAYGIAIGFYGIIAWWMISTILRKD